MMKNRAIGRPTNMMTVMMILRRTDKQDRQQLRRRFGGKGSLILIGFVLMGTCFSISAIVELLGE